MDRLGVHALAGQCICHADCLHQERSTNLVATGSMQALNRCALTGELIESMTAASQEVQPALLALANKDAKFKKGHSRGARGGQGGGRGRGKRQVSSPHAVK